MTQERENKFDRAAVLLFNKALTRARYNKTNLELIQNVDPIANALTNDDIAEIIKSSMGNATAVEPDRKITNFSYTQKYACLLCSYNLQEQPWPPRIAFRPSLFVDISSNESENEVFTEFKYDLRGDWGSLEEDHPAVMNPCHEVIPTETMTIEHIVMMKKLTAYDMLLKDGQLRKSLKVELQDNIVEYETTLLTLYKRIKEMMSAHQTDFESHKVELGIGYLMIALEEDGLLEVFKNKAAEKGLIISNDRLEKIKNKARAGNADKNIPYRRRLSYVPLESNFEQTTADVENLFASNNENNLDLLIQELSKTLDAQQGNGRF